MGKASRRKREQSAEAAPCNIRKEDKEPAKEHPFFTKLMRKPLTYALIGATALGGWFVAKQTPFWTGAEPRYTLDMVFLPHNSAQKAKQILAAVDSANDHGIRYDIIFMEAAGLKTSRFMDLAMDYSSAASNLRRAFSSKEWKGRDAEITAEWEKELRAAYPDWDDFSVTLVAGVTLRGLKIIPIEKYTDEESAVVDGFETKTFGSAFTDLDRGGATLKELMLCTMKTLAAPNEIIRFRNVKIAHGLEGMFDYAKRLSFELRARGLLGRQIHAIGCMGLLHRPVYYRYNGSNGHPQIDLSKREFYDNGSVLESMVAGKVTERLFEREAYELAFGLKYERALEAVRRTTPQPEFQRYVSNIMRLKSREWGVISDRSAKIGGPDQRDRFVLASAFLANTNLPYDLDADKIH
jgi:hypothetical protein